MTIGCSRAPSGGDGVSRNVAPAAVPATGVSDEYGRLFPHLPALAVEEAQLRKVGRRGGPCDMGLHAEGPDSETDAVWPFFGQFVAHDLTADRSPLGSTRRETNIVNAHGPKANLETLYGSDAAGGAAAYSRDDP